MVVGDEEFSEKQAALQYPQQQELYPSYSPRLSTPDSRTKNNIDHDLHGVHCGEKDCTRWGDYPVWTPPQPPKGNSLSDNDSTRPHQHQGLRSSHSLFLQTTSITLGDPDCSIRSGRDPDVSVRRYRSSSYPRKKGMITPYCYRTNSNQPQDRRSPLPLGTPGDIIPATSESLLQEEIGPPLTNAPGRPVQDETRCVQDRQTTSPQTTAYQENKTHRDETKRHQKRRRNANNERLSMSEKRLPGA